MRRTASTSRAPVATKAASRSAARSAQNRFFFFGGYQHTSADTGFVPTASSISATPQALQAISGERTKANLLAAFAALNPGISAQIPKADCASPTDTACISDVAVKLFNLRNPVTGDYVIPAPRQGGTVIGNDLGGNPIVRQRNVVPAKFSQDQYTLKLDGKMTESNRLSATIFYAVFPALDPFPDPSSLISPFTLKRDDHNLTVALSDTQILGAGGVNEVRGGMFYLNNTRQLDDVFLDLTNESVGIPNPANNFDASVATTRLGHYIGRPGGTLERFSFGGPNDTFNKREQHTWTLGDTLSWNTASHAFRVGGEFRRNEFDTNLPEEQATEFEKFDSITQLLRGLSTEADTQFGITDKQFRFNDFNLFFADDWRISRSLTLNLGLRYEFFGWPTEVNGRIGNLDFEALTNTENPTSMFIVPGNVQMTGFAAVDGCHRGVAEGSEQPHAEGTGLEQHRAQARLRLDTGQRQHLGDPRWLRSLLRSAVRRLHQHGVQQLSVPARTGSDLPVRCGASERGLVAAGSELPVQSVPAEPHRAHDDDRRRHVSGSRQHQRDARRRRDAQHD